MKKVEKNETVITFRLNSFLNEKIREVSLKTGRNISDIVRDAIFEYLMKRGVIK